MMWIVFQKIEDEIYSACSVVCSNVGNCAWWVVLLQVFRLGWCSVSLFGLLWRGNLGSIFLPLVRFTGEWVGLVPLLIVQVLWGMACWCHRIRWACFSCSSCELLSSLAPVSEFAIWIYSFALVFCHPQFLAAESYRNLWAHRPRTQANTSYLSQIAEWNCFYTRHWCADRINWHLYQPASPHSKSRKCSAYLSLWNSISVYSESLSCSWASFLCFQQRCLHGVLSLCRWLLWLGRQWKCQLCSL